MNVEVILAILFFFVSILYSSVGLGGGSSYTALMTIVNIDYELIPTITLTLNMVVTFVGMLNFWRGGHLDLKLITPFLVTSVPMAYLGGALELSKEMFFWFLLITLVFVALKIYLWGDLKFPMQLAGWQKLVISMILGATLGFIAGTVGIGGGIYLVPLLIILGLSTEKQAAASGACFIWVNSLSGFIARSQRGTFNMELVFPLIGAVIIGGFIGSHFGSQRFKPRTIQRILGIVILIAIFYLLRNLL